MKNPYKILGLSQNASQAEIARSQVPALRARIFTPKEITEAQTALRKPATRLAADFTFPVFEADEVSLITLNNHIEDIDWEKFDENKFNSLSI